MSSSDYWLNKNGYEYLDQQINRDRDGNPQYRQQEKWLARYLTELAIIRQKKIRVLDYGCGFGRFARIFADRDDLIYFGFDISKSMVQPLFDAPPSSLEKCLSDRIRIASTLHEAFNEECFDFIFTVSVFIHLPPEQAKNIISSMRRTLSPQGEICLIENQLIPISIYENNWHEGCWVHNHVEETLNDMDIQIFSGIINNSDIYIAKEKTSSQRKIFISLLGDPLKECEEESLDHIGIKKLKSILKSSNQININETQVSLEGRLLDCLEFNKYLSRDVKLLLEAFNEICSSLNIPKININDPKKLNFIIKSVIDEINTLKREVEKNREIISEQSNILKIREKISTIFFQDSIINSPQIHTSDSSANSRFHHDNNNELDSGDFDWNLPQDIKLAHKKNSFSRVCHVYHYEWVGIRNAAKYLPGHKLAISSTKVLSVESVRLIKDILTKNSIDRLVFHGMSNPMVYLLRSLKIFGLDHLYVVWHGTTAQLAYENERDLFDIAMILVNEKIIRRFHAIRKGLQDVIGPLHFNQQLPNIPPYMDRSNIFFSHNQTEALAFIPSWNTIGKNLYGNLMAAEINKKIRKIWVLGEVFPLPHWRNSKMDKIIPPNKFEILNYFEPVDITLNATIIDCHPMVNLESLAVGRPAIQGPLFLDVLEKHPYTQLVTVQNPLSVQDISEKIDNIFSIPSGELREIMEDYYKNLIEISIDRYSEFLEI